MNARLAQEVTGFAAWAVATSALVVLGVPIVSLGAVLVVFDGVAWVLPVGCVVMVGAVVTAWRAHRRILRCKELLAQPRRRDQVFISYRTDEHAVDAARVAAVLRAGGLGVYFARPGDVAFDPARPLSALRTLGLFQTGELDADLQRAMAGSDAIVYFLPNTGRRPAIWRSLKDSLDAVIALVVFWSGMTRTFWRTMLYTTVYERPLSPVAFTKLFGLGTWQAWELATARQLGLVVVKLRVGDGAGEDGDQETVCLHSETLESDVERTVLPQLRAAVRTELEVQPLVPTLMLIALGWVILGSAVPLSLLAIGAFVVVTLL
ncbi:MAG: hypothetical protein QOI73_3475 [Solirubrobacteraceae bacterium]|nr:hypothetical protein [Solirubrobacteraceae bacterium]